MESCTSLPERHIAPIGGNTDLPKRRSGRLVHWSDRFAHLQCALAIVIAFSVLSCGGGTSTPQPSPSPGPPPQPCQVYPLWVMPGRVSIAQQSSETIAVGLNGFVTVPGEQCSGFFTSPVTVQVSRLPSGVRVSPASLLLTPDGPPEPLTAAVSASATPGNAVLTLTGTSSTMTASINLPLSVMPANPLIPTSACPSSTPPPAPNPNPAPNEWTWESGSNAPNQPGVYGTQGVPSTGNVPGARVKPSSWTDSSGNFWLFGGYGVESAQADHNDLWRYGNGEWTWMGGSNLTEQSGLYGTRGTPAPGNVPGARYLAASWTDASGNFWLFGGLGLDSSGTRGDLNDLWKYNPATAMWTWMGGPSSLCNLQGVGYACAGIYGTQGVPSPNNAPGSRTNASSWTDSCGNLWLFGGDGWDSTGMNGPLNDLWKYDPVTKLWTWMSGANIGDQNGTYGTMGVPNPGNVVGARVGAVTWTDKSGNLWLFGGEGSDVNGIVCEENGKPCDLNDLWRYDPATNTWTWINGSDVAQQPGVYGTKGRPDPGNAPGGRDSAVSWTDAAGNFWLFGGSGYDSRTNPKVFGDLNDLWKYDPATNVWTWMSGSDTAEQLGTYGTLGTPGAGDVPGARFWAVGWIDRSGSLWLFGGFEAFVWPNVRFNDLWKYQP